MGRKRYSIKKSDVYVGIVVNFFNENWENLKLITTPDLQGGSMFGSICSNNIDFIYLVPLDQFCKKINATLTIWATQSGSEKDLHFYFSISLNERGVAQKREFVGKEIKDFSYQEQQKQVSKG